jgi:hypothetical protein
VQAWKKRKGVKQNSSRLRREKCEKGKRRSAKINRQRWTDQKINRCKAVKKGEHFTPNIRGKGGRKNKTQKGREKQNHHALREKQNKGREKRTEKHTKN